MAFNRRGYWVKRSQGEICAIVKADEYYNDMYWDWKKEEFDDCPNPVMELGMSDEWDKMKEEDILKELGWEDW